ncbi:MAG: hypothetical protein R2712_27055 [Vicinamibacterales bacterium]
MTNCHDVIAGEHFDVNGQSVCASCHDRIRVLGQPAVGLVPVLLAGLAGLAAAVLGAVLYYADFAISGLEIGLVAIAIGYMVGYSVRRGAGGRGGRRLQVLAVVLTYWAVGLGYVPMVISAAIEQEAAREQASTSPLAAPRASPPRRPDRRSHRPRRPGRPWRRARQAWRPAC